MRIFGEIQGVSKIPKRFKDLEANIVAGQIRAVAEATLQIHSAAVKSLQENTDGTPAIRYNPKRVVVVSKPGAPPNTDTGRAVQSIQVQFASKGLIGRVGTNLKYLAWLEWGTKNVAARPWLRPAVEKVSRTISKLFRDAVAKSIKETLS